MFKKCLLTAIVCGLFLFSTTGFLEANAHDWSGGSGSGNSGNGK